MLAETSVPCALTGYVELTKLTRLTQSAVWCDLRQVSDAWEVRVGHELHCLPPGTGHLAGHGLKHEVLIGELFGNTVYLRAVDGVRGGAAACQSVYSRFVLESILSFPWSARNSQKYVRVYGHKSIKLSQVN